MSAAIKRKRIIRTAQLFVLDAFSVFTSFGLAVLLFAFLDTTVDVNRFFMMIPIIILLKILFFVLMGLYRVMPGHAGFEDIIKVVIVSIFTNAFLLGLLAAMDMEFIHALSFAFITPLEIMLVSFPRIVKKLWRYISMNMNWSHAAGKRTLILGAGDGGELVIREIYRNKALDNIPVAFADDNPEKIGNKLLGVPVVGNLKNISQIIDKYNIEEVIIAIANLSLKRLQELVGVVAEKDVKIRRLPLMSEIEDEGMPYKVKDVQVEDLMERDQVQLDNEGIADLIKGQVVLVTGGGGSIGSELCRQIANFKPKQLIIFDIYENSAYDIQMELLRKHKKQKLNLDLQVLIGSVYDEARMEEIFSTYKPAIVFHAAAYKHVPLMEDSPKEAVRTNILGTYYTAQMAKEYKAKNFVLVSSDKAVRPTSIMGATKRYAELIIQDFAKEKNGTKYSAVRFGNVLDSNGSVIPLFRKQIEEGGPVTVTHPDIKRYFMTIPESVGLILQSAVYSQGGEIFILDMGEPIKIKDLAEKMIKLAGFRVGRDIDIEYVGLRPGEKLYEELLITEEKDMERTANDKIYVEKTTKNGDSIDFPRMRNCLYEKSLQEIKQELAQSITSYKNDVQAKA